MRLPLRHIGILLAISSICIADPRPASAEDLEDEQSLVPDDEVADKLIPRAANDAAPIHGRLFTENNGIDAALAAAPVWLFGRIKGKSPCYPESAVKIGSKPLKPNPGTRVPLSNEAGKDCTDPGDYKGTMSPGKPFPNYYSATYCPHDDSWRIRYDVYYVHDGAVSVGHRHDWEFVAVIWKRDGDKTKDMWKRDSFSLSHHSSSDKRGWGQIESVNNDGDLKDTDKSYRAHPKVYVGYYKHPGFFSKKTSVITMDQTRNEFRSDDWFFIPQRPDMHPLSEINKDWKYKRWMGAQKRTTNPAGRKQDFNCGL